MNEVSSSTSSEETTNASAGNANDAAASVREVRDLPIVPAAHPEIALLLGLLDESTTHWRNEMLYVVSDEFPEGWGRVEPTVDQIVWQPFPGGHSIGGVLLHIAKVETFWLHEVAGGDTTTGEQEPLLLFTPADQEAVDTVQWPTPPRQPLSWYFAQLDAVRARTKEMLRNASPSDIHTNARDGQRLSLRWLLGYVALHDSYHGGQAVLLFLSQRAQK